MFPMIDMFDIIYVGKKLTIKNRLHKITAFKIKSILKETEAIMEAIVINIDTCIEQQ